MAENKKGFILYADYLEDIQDLVIDDREDGTNNAGELFLMIMEYVNDLDPEPVNKDVRRAFNPIKRQLKRDLDKWEDTKEQKSESGSLGNLKRWHPDLYKQVSDNEIDISKAWSIVKDRRVSHPDSEGSEPIANIAVNDSVTVNDTVSVTDTVNDNVKEKVIKKKTTIADKNPLHAILKSKFMEFYQKRTGEEFYWDAKSGFALKQLILKIKKKLAEKEIEQTDEKLTESFEAFLSRIQDDWILNNLSIAIINSKFNEIIQNGKQGSTTNGKGTKITAEKVKEFLARQK